MERSVVRVVLVVLATIGMIVINAIHPVFSPTGKNNGEISNQFQNFFTPAGYVFSIWGLIYLALIAFTIYQALPSQRNNPRLAKIDILYAVSCVFNSAWLIVWQREWFALSLVVMVGILLSLVAIYVRLDDTRYKLEGREGWLVHWPFSMYLGWITVATVANATIVLQDLGWKGAGVPGPTWGAIMVCAAFVIVLAVTFPRKDRAYILVLVWATIGIAVKYKATLLMVATASSVAGVSLLTAAYYFLQGRKESTTP